MPARCGLPKGYVVIIDKNTENYKKFIKDINVAHTQEKVDNRRTNRKLRSFGTVYDIENFKKWYNNIIDGEISECKGHPARKEKKSWLYMHSVDYIQEDKSRIRNSEIKAQMKYLLGTCDESRGLPPDRPQAATGIIHSHFFLYPGNEVPSPDDHRTWLFNRIWGQKPIISGTHRDVLLVGFGMQEDGAVNNIKVVLYNASALENISITHNSFKDKSVNEKTVTKAKAQ